MNPYDRLESEQTRIGNKRHFPIDNKQYLCDHSDLHIMIARRSEYIPGNIYNQMKETFIKNCKAKNFWDYIQVKTFLISLIIKCQRST